MSNVPQNQQGYPGQQTPFDETSTEGMQRFMVEQVLGRVNTAMLVQVKGVTNKGEVKEVGFVDVQPLAKLMDGKGNTYSHGVVNGLPYFRLQGGADKAVILDPKVNDIGVAVFADRDISGVKRSKKESPPGSFRRFDMADGMFFPCFLGGKPSCYVRFTDTNDVIISPDDDKVFLTIQKNPGKIEMKVGSTKIRVEDGKIRLIGADIDHLQSE